MRTINRLTLLAICVLTTLFALAQGGNPPASTKQSGATSGHGMTGVEQSYPSQGPQQTLLNMENNWTKAAAESNSDAVAAMLASDYVNTDSDGSVYDKAQTLSRIKHAKWQTNEISDVKVHVNGNTAVVTGIWTGKGTDPAGKAVDARERWTDTWTKMPDGKWQCIASESTPIK